MGDAPWKVVVDRQGMTIASDRFQLTANGLSPDEAVFDGMETGQLETIVSELQRMTWRSYGQFCGLAHAMEVIGERWAMLIVRDLLVHPKTVDQLHQGFPRLPIDILCTRLKELEHNGIVRRSRRPQPDAPDTMVYELTGHGRGLEAVAVELARWGAQTMGEAHPDQVVTPESLIIAIRSAFRADAAAGTRAGFEVRYGDIVIHAVVDGASLVAGAGALTDPDLVVETGPALQALMAGDVTPAEALAAADLRVTGDPALLDRFVEIFHIPRLPPRSA